MIIYDVRETHICATTREDINNLLYDVNEAYDDRLPAPEKNSSLHEILTYQYINRDLNGVLYTIVGKHTVKKMQQNLMG